MKTISIVVPVFNEEDNIEHFYESVCKVMESLPYDFELIYVDDGSKDRSREILRSLEKQAGAVHFPCQEFRPSAGSDLRPG